MEAESSEALRSLEPPLELSRRGISIEVDRNLYGDGSVSINFAPGPVGLELQPVIISSEREIGCRIKDFYFGLDYHGVTPEILQATLSVGDVITYIGNRNVQSAKFSDILELLRSLRDCERRIVFKNISASCQ